MLNEQNVIDFLFIGTGIAIILALVIAGQWQEIRMKRKNKANIEQINQQVSRYARMRAVLADSSKVIKGGH